MQNLIDFLLLFGVVFAVVLLGMLAFMKLAHGRVEPGPEEQREKAKYMEGAPSDLSGPDSFS